MVKGLKNFHDSTLQFHLPSILGSHQYLDILNEPFYNHIHNSDFILNILTLIHFH